MHWFVDRLILFVLIFLVSTTPTKCFFSYENYKNKVTDFFNIIAISFYPPF